MKKILFTILLSLILAHSPLFIIGIEQDEAIAADVVLEVTVPDAWVARASAAVLSQPICTELGLNAKKCAEYLMRKRLKQYVVDYDNKTNQELTNQTQGFVEITEDDVPITISGE